MSDIPLYTADTLNIFGFQTAISLALVAAGVILFPILIRRTSTWPPRVMISLACATLFLFGLGRLLVIGVAFAAGPKTVDAPLEFKTQVNYTGRNQITFESWVLALYDKTKGTFEEINRLPPDDRLDRYVKVEVSESAFALSKEGSCYEIMYYPLPRYVPMLLFFKSLDSDPFIATLQNADASKCQ